MANNNEAIKILQSGGIGVMPTDTIYGLVGRAFNRQAVERIYGVRRRRPDKPFIILISSLAELELFSIKLNEFEKEFLKKNWPGAVSVILPCASIKFKYLHRGTKSLAFRLPKNHALKKLLGLTGPLVAPSANPEGLPPADDLNQAKQYFGDKIDFYYGRGEFKSKPSTLVKLHDGNVDILREGAIKIKK